MKNLSVWLAGAAAFVGIIAAVFWWLSARVDQSFKPRPPIGDVTEDLKLIPGYLEDIYRQLFKFSDGANAVAQLNKWAALLTGVSVALSGLSSWFGSSSS